MDGGQAQKRGSKKMKIIFFDAGPIISLVMSRLEWILPELKKKFNGKFYITPAVEYELVERPITIKRFQFEALQVLKLIREGTLEVYKEVPAEKARELENLADSSFRIEKKYIDLMQRGEMESVASALKTNADAVVVDERTLRLFIENSSEMEKLLERRFQRDVIPVPQMMKQFSKQLQGINIIRSIELVSVAYKMGLLNPYVPQRKEGKEILLESVLWATKFNGCAVTGQEVEEIKEYLLGK